MKKIALISTLSLIFSISQAKKNDSLKVAAGVFIAPHGFIDLQNPSLGFKTSAPVSVQVTLAKKKYFQSVFYTMTGNSFGTAVWYSTAKKLSSYIVVTKNILTEGGYAGAGIGTKLAGGRATGFTEIGGDWSNFRAGLSIGIFIPFMANLN